MINGSIIEAPIVYIGHAMVDLSDLQSEKMYLISLSAPKGLSLPCNAFFVLSVPYIARRLSGASSYKWEGDKEKGGKWPDIMYGS